MKKGEGWCGLCGWGEREGGNRSVWGVGRGAFVPSPDTHSPTYIYTHTHTSPPSHTHTPSHPHTHPSHTHPLLPHRTSLTSSMWSPQCRKTVKRRSRSTAAAARGSVQTAMRGNCGVRAYTLYRLYTFIATYAPICTRYTCTYNIYTSLYIIYTSYIHL